MLGAKQSRSVALAALLAAALVSSIAAAQCVRVLGYEWDGENQSMDPVGLLGTDNVYHIRAVYEPLVDRDDHLRPIPVLAESWESNSDGSVWTFKLRRGVKFHDGSELQAEDVVFTYRRLLDLKIAPRAAAGLSFLKADGIEAVDAYTVRFKLAKPVAELPLLIATKYAMVVSRTAKSEDLKLRENGTGPFVQERFSPNGPVRILKRNPNYWQSGLPKAECLEIKVVQEASSRAAA